MAKRRPSARLSRREFLIRGGIAGAGVAATAGLWPNFLRRAEAAPDLKGSGEVIVPDGGGAWGAAQATAYFEPFEAATGIKVVRNVAIGSVATGRLLADAESGSPSADYYELGAANVPRFVAKDLLDEVDYQWFDPADLKTFAPVKLNKYYVPDIYFSMVLAYDPRKFSGNPPKTWADFWDVKRFPGDRSLAPGSRGASSATLEIALLADGVSPNRLYPLDVERALRSLSRIRPSIVKFWESGAEGPQLLNDGQVVMTSAWNGRVADLQAKGGNIAYTWNQGILQWSANSPVKKAKNRENAMKFLAFVARPQNQAKFSELITYGPTNSRAYQFIKPERAAVLPTAPAMRSEQVLQNVAWWTSLTPSGATNEEAVARRWEEWITTGK